MLFAEPPSVKLQPAHISFTLSIVSDQLPHYQNQSTGCLFNPRATMSRRQAKGEYIETVRSPSTIPYASSHSLGQRQQDLTKSRLDGDPTHHARRQNRHPARSRHSRRPCPRTDLVLHRRLIQHFHRDWPLRFPVERSRAPSTRSSQ